MDNSLSGFVKDNIGASTPQSKPDDEYANQAFISDAINEEKALNELDAESKPTVVVLIGFPEYGKTSFVATCYQLLLQNGKIGEFLFYDSDTFIGFERRAFARRMTDNSTTSGTKRTVRGEASLLTLRFAHPTKGNNVVVFSDKSGETYSDYSIKKNLVAQDRLLPYADRLLFFIDCKAVVGHEFMALKDDYDTLLKNMKEAQLPSKGTIINLIFNKYDLVNDTNRQRFNSKKAELVSLFSNLLVDIPLHEFFIVSNDITHADSVSELLLDIIKNSAKSCEVDKDSNINLDWAKNLLKDKQL
jgi:hypothetical protein